MKVLVTKNKLKNDTVLYRFTGHREGGASFYHEFEEAELAELHPGRSVRLFATPALPGQFLECRAVLSRKCTEVPTLEVAMVVNYRYLTCTEITLDELHELPMKKPKHLLYMNTDVVEEE